MKKKYVITSFIISFVTLFLLVLKGAIGLNIKEQVYNDKENKAGEYYLLQDKEIANNSWEENEILNDSYEMNEVSNDSYEIEKIIKENAIGYEDNISLYYYNFNTNEEYYYNGDEYYVAASTTKIPLSMMVADDVHSGLYSMDTEIDYITEDYEEGTGVLWNQDYIDDITVEDAIYLSIVHSDNITKNMLRRVATQSTYNYISNISGEILSNSNENKYTVKQLGQVLKSLYINEENNPYYEDILQYMKETIFHDRLDKYLPYENVAHKIGNYYRYYHDIGIVYGKEDYVLAIMTKDIGELDDDYYAYEDERMLLDGGELASQIIADISLEIYNLINS